MDIATVDRLKLIKEELGKIIMLSLFEDLFIRMFVIVGMFDLIMWWYLGRHIIVLSVFIMEMVVITISLWFDIIHKREKFNLKGYMGD